ncbi:site-specific tyrosine recombinase/integron integrase [Neorickettsia sp. 179522]|uniref:site-specific tyrosine recombinase/integron integrase n=1 Tax=Neorickettsia sp. 179522 TaxID=1714371 RepID=UPI000794FDC8|nr:site-specific tyrosine recombinase/integron integrase [Neorickettsia sp. 179522]KYH12300.1 recombinase XerD [Neorickettsia sp. 179522]
MQASDCKYVEQFLEKILVERNATLNTISSYRTDLRLLSAFFKNKGLQNASKEDLYGYIANLRAQQLSNATIRRKIATFRQFFSFLYSEKISSSNPAQTLELPKKTLVLPRYLTKEEVLSLLTFLETGQPTTLRLYTILEILYSSGMRVSELINLKISDIRPLLNGQQHIIITGKGRKERILPFSKKAIQVLRLYLTSYQSNSPWLFPGAGRKDRPISRQRLGQLLKELALKCNIDPKRISPHVIRHSFATHLLDNGMDIKVVQDLLGHAQITTTQIYTHISQNKLRKEIESKHPLSLKKIGQTPSSEK